MTLRGRAATAAVALLLPLLATTAAHAEPQGGRGPASTLAGVATTDLSPTAAQLAAGDIFMGGYGGYRSRGPAEGVSDRPVLARALALQSGRESVVFLTIDTTVIGSTVMQAIRAGAAAETGILEHNILVSATHTHGGPDVNGLWGGVSPEYKAHFIAQAVRAVDEATDDLQHATLRSAVVQAPEGLASNRRDVGYTDRALGVLQVRSGGQTLATMVNFAVHPVVLGSSNKLLHSDFVGGLQAEVERQLGGTALFVNGALGDASPVRPAATDQYAAADEYGRLLAEQVVRAVSQAKNVPPGLTVETVPVTLPVENPAFVGAYRAGLFNGYAEMRQEGGAYYFDTLISRLTLGRGPHAVEMVTVPGEAITTLGLDLREIVPGDREFLLGLTHDTLGYLIPAADWDPTGYEESVSLGVQAGGLVREAIAQLYGSG